MKLTHVQVLLTVAAQVQCGSAGVAALLTRLLLKRHFLHENRPGRCQERSVLLVSEDLLHTNWSPWQCVVLAVHQAGVEGSEAFKRYLIELIEAVDFLQSLTTAAGDLLGVIENIRLNVLVKVLVEGHMSLQRGTLGILSRSLDQSNNDHDEHEDGGEAAEDDDERNHPIKVLVCVDTVCLTSQLPQPHLLLILTSSQYLSVDQPPIPGTLHINTDKQYY